jgi:glycosyltransferase involved in cell wall biosynthesis
MAAGVPFCASDFPAWRGMFSGYGAGEFADSESLDATVETLAGMLADPDACTRMGRAGQRAVGEGLTFEAQSEVLLGLTAELLGDAACD